MAILTIDGVAVHDPSSFQVDIMDLSSEETGRLLNGNANKDIVAIKRKLNCSWNVLTWSQCSHLLKQVKNKPSFTVVYPDPEDGIYVSKRFYVGDRTAPAIMLANGKEYWNGVSFNFIEI